MRALLGACAVLAIALLWWQWARDDSVDRRLRKTHEGPSHRGEPIPREIPVIYSDKTLRERVAELSDGRRLTILVRCDGVPKLPEGLSFENLTLYEQERDEAKGLVEAKLSPRDNLRGTVVRASAPGFFPAEQQIHRRPDKLVFDLTSAGTLVVLTAADPKLFLVEQHKGSWGRVPDANRRPLARGGGFRYAVRRGPVRARVAGTGLILGYTTVETEATLHLDLKNCRTLKIRVELPGNYKANEVHLDMTAPDLALRHRRLRPARVEGATAHFEMPVIGDRIIEFRPYHPQLIPDPSQGELKTAESAVEEVIRMVARPSLRFSVRGDKPTSLRVLLYHKGERVHHGGIHPNANGFTVPVERPGTYNVVVSVRRRPVFRKAGVEVTWSGADLGEISLR